MTASDDGEGATPPEQPDQPEPQPESRPAPLGHQRATAPRQVRRPSRRPLFFAGRRIYGYLAIAVAVILVGGAIAAYAKYRSIWDSIGRVQISDLGKRPPKYTNALNLLLFGSDSRTGLTRKQQLEYHVGDAGCGCSDTIMVVHISPGRHRVTVLNIPRDTMVPVYQCDAHPAVQEPGQVADPQTLEQINFTLQRGGPSCLWKTVEHVTGIYIDHFIQLSFLGAVKVINDIGGVNVCVPFAIDDPNSGLHISAGRKHIYGLRFLELWRARYTIGNGSDLERIQRDDFLLAQVLKGVIRRGISSSPTKLLQVVTDAAAAMTTDAGLTPGDMLHIADSLRGLHAGHVQFIEAPTQTYPPQPAQVEFVQPEDDQLFGAIAHDQKLQATTDSKNKKNKHDTGQTPAPMTSPQAVKVKVLNGSGVNLIASQVGSDLSARGFDVVGTSDATTPGGSPDFSYTSSVIQYQSAAQLPAVNTLKAQLTSVIVRLDPSLPPGTINLIVGSSFTSLAADASASPSPSSSTSINNLSHQYGGIKGDAACKSDSGAFQGPNSP
jgi:LCP family protein required for cell wall assembly